VTPTLHLPQRRAIKVIRPRTDSREVPSGEAQQPAETISPEDTSEDAAGLTLAASGQATAIWLRAPTYGTHLIETADYEPA
jgi:hypothetical protein